MIRTFNTQTLEQKPKNDAYELHHSSDYDDFELSEFNRDLRGLKKLIASMKKYGFMPAFPLLCVPSVKNGAFNGKLKIICGHHRFEAAKNLGIEVYYVVFNSDISIMEIERTANSWTAKDFVVSHARAGSDSHLILAKFCDQTGICYSQAAKMMSQNSTGSKRNIRSKHFEADDCTHAERVGRLVVELKNSGVAFANVHGLVAALDAFCLVKEFNEIQLIKRVRTNLGMVVRQASIAQYISLLDTIYNRASAEKIPLAFLATEALRNRQEVIKKNKTGFLPKVLKESYGA